ncbi:SDR family NAD(P)-dependent oxidoreductase [Streptomyces sp. Je 1-369]|uniref:SDR family NAD(P)-dependent oxidoreductase n=1 Tax=Streptomyces sp. Je 1-369 TaxID=2966192 RepID=UPI0022866299|nr:SDR family NAD(P)-dependent oxidoreductase [Streptomyces sp. Je 1-369]WAL99697.1 SDR family oxidoreductase [Streptomyces sp. Je 1-369]
MPTLRSEKEPTGLSACVTGGSRGLGLLIADQLAARGCAVTLAARDREELEQARSRLLGRHPGAVVDIVVCDVRDQDEVRSLMRGTYERRGGLDVVIANAGIIQVAPVESIGAEEFQGAMDTMFKGTLHAALEALPYLRKSPHGGRLGIISSVGGLLGVPHLLPYACAKAAAGVLAEGLHAEAAADGVSVTAVYPGLMRTGSHLHARFGGDRTAEYAWFSALAGTPLVSMNAQRAAARITRAVLRRRVRLVLTPMARAADLVHGVAPGLTTRVSSLAARALPSGTGRREPLAEGKDTAPPAHPVAARVRAWGSALNDKVTHPYNQHHG